MQRDKHPRTVQLQFWIEVNVHHQGLLIYALSVVGDVPLHIMTEPAVSQHNEVVHLVARNITELINMHVIPLMTVLHY